MKYRFIIVSILCFIGLIVSFVSLYVCSYTSDANAETIAVDSKPFCFAETYIGLDVDSNGNIYVLTSGERVLRFDSNGDYQCQYKPLDIAHRNVKLVFRIQEDLLWFYYDSAAHIYNLDGILIEKTTDRQRIVEVWGEDAIRNRNRLSTDQAYYYEKENHLLSTYATISVSQGLDTILIKTLIQVPILLFVLFSVAWGVTLALFILKNNLAWWQRSSIVRRRMETTKKQ